MDPHNTSETSYYSAQLVYAGISNLFQNETWNYFLPADTTVIIGETNNYNPNNAQDTWCPAPDIDSDAVGYTDPYTGITYLIDVDCAPDWHWHPAWSASSAYDNASAFATVGFSQPTVLRPWVPAGWNFIETPAPLSGNNALPYNVVLTPGTKIGVFRNNAAFLEDSIGVGTYYPVADRYIPAFTGPGGFMMGDYPVTGDWTGDGHAKAGIYRSTTGQWFLDANNDGVYDTGDYTYGFGGIAGDIPKVGDWSNLGKDCVGIYRGGQWLLDLNCNGVFDNAPTDAFFGFGGLWGDVPVVGRWIGGNMRVGVVRCYEPVQGQACQAFYWIFDGSDANNPCMTDQCHQVATQPQAFPFGGEPGDLFVTGDWYSTGTSRAGVYRSGLWLLDANGDQLTFISAVYGGASGDLPITGKW